MKKVMIISACALALGLAPATAAPVAAGLDVSVGEPLVSASYASCSVSVQSGADGAAILDAAVASGCIDSYETQTFASFGRYVACIDGICGNDAMFWRMTINGAYATFGIDDLETAAGDVLGFSYTTWVTCFPVEVAC